MFAELSKPEELMVIVVTLLAYGCPRQAIVQALDLDERTVARWQQRAGVHCHPVHEDQMMRARLDLGHVQADEIRRLTQRGAFAASFGMQGNIILAEPDALIWFAGPRVIEQFIHQKLPADADTSQLLLHHGIIEAIIPRSELRTTLLLPLLLSL